VSDTVRCNQCEQPVGGDERYHFVVVNVETGEALNFCSGDCIRMWLEPPPLHSESRGDEMRARTERKIHESLIKDALKRVLKEIRSEQQPGRGDSCQLKRIGAYMLRDELMQGLDDAMAEVKAESIERTEQ
jgi:hypothetical protein